MTLKTNTINRGVVIDDGNVRVVVDVAERQVRLFSHYTNDEGTPKLRTMKVVEFETLLGSLETMFGKGIK